MMRCSKEARLWIEILAAGSIGSSLWMRLSRTVGPARIAEMLRSEGGRRELGRLLGRKIAPPDREVVRRTLEVFTKGECGAVAVTDEGYPSLLREIADPPPLLYYRGSLSVFGRPSVCIVGSRAGTRRGVAVARMLGRELSRRGIAVVSGLARGIDRAAHEGALGGDGGTCAVLGCGIDGVYPPEHGPLADRIASCGAILSEHSPGALPLRYHFPLRNRILAGLSLGVVVVEAGERSGALGTARWAVDQGREVFAVPGPIDEDLSRGPHRLIREGARLVENVEDIIAEFPPCGRIVEPAGALMIAPDKGLSAPERLVFDSMDLNPKHIDELVEICHIPATTILPVLLGLEMRGMVDSCGGGMYALRPVNGKR